MRLLLDQNLSFRLVLQLFDTFPGTVHVKDAGLENADDQAVWAYARTQGLTIVSKDSDFVQRSLLFGPPPKVIWLRIGNCTTAAVERMLRARSTAIEEFAAETAAGLLILDPQ